MTGKVIYSLLSSLASGKVFPVIAPEETQPDFIVYRKISTVPTDDHDGQPVNVERWQIDLVSKTYAGIITLSDSVKSAMNLQSGTIQTVKVDSIRFADEQDFFDGNPDFFRRSQDYMIRIKT